MTDDVEWRTTKESTALLINGKEFLFFPNGSKLERTEQGLIATGGVTFTIHGTLKLTKSS